MADSARARLLIIDDELELINALCETLADEGFETVGTMNGADGLERLSKQSFDLLLCDLMMPEMDGIQVIRKALEMDPIVVGIIMTGQGTIPTAVEAMRVGAFDYVLKPFNLEAILPILERALSVRRLREENVRLRQYVERLQYESPRYQLIGSGPAMQKIVRLIEKVAPVDSTILIRGPSGTGKELVARAVHHNSARRDQPLVTINCAALQESLLENELFGHEKGAFTGAIQAKPGLMELADQGTLFIDEVAEMSTGLQAKLLRVLEDGSFRRVGGTRLLHSHARIIAATNKSLEDEMRAGRFREDLFYRLNVITIDLPALRERREDIPALVAHLLTTRQIGTQPWDVAPDAMSALCNYSWPGNIRELANVLERAQILAQSNHISLEDLPDSLQQPSTAAEVQLPTLRLGEMECRLVAEALRQAGGNKVQAASALGVSRRSLYRLIEKCKLDNVHPRSQH